MRSGEKKLTAKRSIQRKAYAVTGVVASVFPSHGSILKGLMETTGPVEADTAEKILKTTCFMCHGQCGLLCHVRDGRLVKVEGNPKDPLNRGTI